MPKKVLAYHVAIYIDCWLGTADSEPERVYTDKMILPLQRFLDCELSGASYAKLPDTPLNDQNFGIMEIEDEEFELTVHFCGSAGAYISERRWSKE